MNQHRQTEPGREESDAGAGAPRRTIPLRAALGTAGAGTASMLLAVLLNAWTQGSGPASAADVLMLLGTILVLTSAAVWLQTVRQAIMKRDSAALTVGATTLTATYAVTVILAAAYAIQGRMGL